MWGFLSQAPGGGFGGSGGRSSNGALMEAPSEGAIRELYRLLGAPEEGVGGGGAFDPSQMPGGVEVQGYFQVGACHCCLRLAMQALVSLWWGPRGDVGGGEFAA